MPSACRSIHPLVGVVLLATSLSACNPVPETTSQFEIRPSAIAAHMRYLADDLLEGRASGTPGYDLAARYVASQFEAYGLDPAGSGEDTESAFYQNVPLRMSRLDEGRSSFTLVMDSVPRTLSIGDEVLISPSFAAKETSVRATMRFVGYGIHAPELEHDDYAGPDLDGRIAVVLSGAPERFPSTERAVLSSLGIKAREVARRGGVGLIVVRTSADRDRRPWRVLQERASFPSMDWIDENGIPQGLPSSIQLVATLHHRVATDLFLSVDQDIDSVASVAAATLGGFDLQANAIATTVSNTRDVSSPNVIAMLKGNSRPREYVVFSSHLDHVGRGPEVEGDAVYNGAYDNASGIAVLLEMARVFSERAENNDKAGRSLVFVALTAEEKGLLGSEYFARNPTVELDGIVANINVDGVLMFHPLLDFVAFGADHSTLSEPVRQAADSLGLTVSPDFMPEEVIFVRSDQYSFVKQGIPAVYTFVGNQTGNSVDGREQLRVWMQSTYHRPSDDMSQEMDFQSGATYAELNLRIGQLIANADERPRWKAGDFLGERFGVR